MKTEITNVQGLTDIACERVRGTISAPQLLTRQLAIWKLLK